MRITDNQRRALIDATISPLRPFRRGFARSKEGPFYKSRALAPLIAEGWLRLYRAHGGDHNFRISAMERE